MKRNDIILIIIVLILGIGALIIMNLSKKEGDKVVVSIAGNVVKTFDLHEDITYNIEGEDGKFNLLVIKDGKAHIEDASCPDKVCINFGEIQYNTEKITCLPNKVVVEIHSSTESDIDGMAN